MKGHSTPSSAWLKKQRGEEVDGRPAPPNDPAQAEPWSKKLPEDDRTGHAALIAGDFKLHRLPGKNGDVTFELYNMASDPNETKDLAASEPDRTTAMRAALEAWQRSVIRSVNGADYK